MTKSELITSIPRIVCHQQNANFLIGIKSIIKPNGFDKLLEKEIRRWSDNGGDYLALANHSSNVADLPSIIIHDSPVWVKTEPSFEKEKIFQQPMLHVRMQEYPELPFINTIVIPLYCLLATSESIVNQYIVYTHTIDLANNLEILNKNVGVYNGITRQGWSIRWGQHLNAMNRGSKYVFHRTIRESWSSTRTMRHIVRGYGLTFEEAMNLEEALVDDESLYPNGLNMIPGGFAGIRYLAKHGFKVQNNRRGRRNWEHRERTIAQFAAHCVKEGRPNPLAAANWKNDAYATSVIVGHPKNFNLEDVRTIRELHESGFGAHDIATRMMVDVGRIHRLLRGATYRRVH